MSNIRDIVKRFKPVYVANNLLHYNRLKETKQLYKKYGLSKGRSASISSSDFDGMTGESPWLDQVDSSFALPLHEDFKAFSQNTQNALLNWSENGYCILKNFFSEREVEEINQCVAEVENKGHADVRSNGKKLMFAIHESKRLRELASPTRLEKINDLLLGKKTKLFQSINFPEGSEQKAHSDTVHMTTFPLGYMMAVWIALEDIGPEQGPVYYYPGSHKLPYILNKDFDHGGNYFLIGKNARKNYEKAIAEVLEKEQLKKEYFLARKGDVLIWHANLLHGGEAIARKGSSRKSMVMHYFAEEVICYHEITQRPTIFKET